MKRIILIGILIPLFFSCSKDETKSLEPQEIATKAFSGDFFLDLFCSNDVINLMDEYEAYLNTNIPDGQILKIRFKINKINNIESWTLQEFNYLKRDILTDDMFRCDHPARTPDSWEITAIITFWNPVCPKCIYCSEGEPCGFNYNSSHKYSEYDSPDIYINTDSSGKKYLDIMHHDSSSDTHEEKAYWDSIITDVNYCC